MQITNFSFLFLFLPLALLLAFLTRKHLRAQNAALLALSLAFYACSGLRGLSVLLALSFAVWLLARLRGRGWQTLGIVVCIAALCYFKYTGFLTDNWNRLIRCSAMPAGTAIGLDKGYALEMVTAGDVNVEYDRLIDRQLERAAITSISGFAKLYTEASKVLTV